MNIHSYNGIVSFHKTLISILLLLDSGVCILFELPILSNSLDFKGVVISENVIRVVSTDTSYALYKYDNTVDIYLVENKTMQTYRNVIEIHSTKKEYLAYILHHNNTIVPLGTIRSIGANGRFRGLISLDIDYIYSNNFSFCIKDKNSRLYTWGEYNYGGRINIPLIELKKLYNYVENQEVKTSISFNYKENDTCLVDIHEVYSNNGAYLAITKNETIITWGEAQYGGGKIITSLINNIKKICAGTYAFYILTLTGKVYILGDVIWEKTINKKYLSNIIDIYIQNKIIYAINNKKKLVWWSYTDNYSTFIGY